MLIFDILSHFLFYLMYVQSNLGICLALVLYYGVKIIIDLFSLRR